MVSATIPLAGAAFNFTRVWRTALLPEAKGEEKLSG
jgi:hypothetical protein